MPSRSQKATDSRDPDELRPARLRIGLHTFLFMRLHGTGLKINSDRTDIVSVADPTRVTFVPD